jgi:hypothetical protein
VSGADRRHLDDVLCFCGADEDGHPLGEDCAVVVKPGRYPSRSGGRYSPSYRGTEHARASLDILRALAKCASTPELRLTSRQSAGIAAAALAEWRRQGY